MVLFQKWFGPFKVTITLKDVLRGCQAARALWPRYASYLATLQGVLEALQTAYDADHPR